MIAALLLAGADPQVIDGWTIERGAEKCSATRTAGIGSTARAVVIKSSVMSDYAGTIAITLPLPPALVQHGEPAAPLPPPATYPVTLEPIGVGATAYADGGAMVASFVLSKAQLAQLAGVRAVELRPVDQVSTAVPLGDTRRMMAAFVTCSADILRGWGADPAAMVETASMRKTASWFKSDDYPKDALRAEVTGRAIFLASVDAAGRAATCRIVVTSGNTSLDARTCDVVMRRAYYGVAPASAPAVRWATGAVNWRL